MATLTAIATEEPAPVEELNPDVPGPLADLIRRLMAKKPADRPPDASAVADECARMLAAPDRPELSTTVNHVPPIAPRRWWRRRTQALVLLGRRRRWWAVAVVGLVGLLVGLGLLLGGATARPGLPPPQPLQAEMIVTITSKDGVKKRGLRVDQPGALPARAKDGFHVEVRLNQPGYVYLVLLSSQGEAVPLSPWNENRIVQEALAEPPGRDAAEVIHSPTAENGDWELDEHDGLETVLLLARKTPLPSGADLAQLIGAAPKVELLNAQEWAVRGGDEGQAVDWLDLGDNRGIKKVARLRDDPLLKIMQRLREHGEVVRAVRFAHKGE
jgi:hypothetical protein